MKFDTKIAIIIRSDLESWQKVNVTAFLSSGIAASYPESIGQPYEDGSGTTYTPLFAQPVLVYGADSAGLTRALDRALSRDVAPAIYTKEMFVTTNDVDNRAVVKAVARTDLDLVGMAIRAERKTVDKIVDKLKFLE